MAPGTDLKSCLMWETEAPWTGTPRQSSFFRLDGEDWCLKIEIWKRSTMSKRKVDDSYDGGVYLLPREDKKMPEKHITVSCHILAGKLIIENMQQVSFLRSRSILLKYHISSQDFQNPSVSSGRWKIFCHISSVKPLSIQMNNETILHSTGPLPPASDPSVQSGAGLPPDFQRLSDDFSRLLDKEILPDAKLTCDGRTWSVHRSVLTARSEVFAAMFASGMTEGETGSVQIEDLEADVLDSLLKYVYGGRLPDASDELVSGLYEAADRYALLGLREACSRRMAEQLSRDNCLRFLVTADARGDDSLKEASTSFVAEHFAQIGKDLWAEFRAEYPLLAINILERFAPSKK